MNVKEKIYKKKEMEVRGRGGGELGYLWVKLVELRLGGGRTR